MAHSKKTFYRFLGIILYLSLNLSMVFFSRGLEQVNSENLFLKKSDFRLYQDFSSHFAEKKILLSKISFPGGPGEVDYKKFNIEVDKLRKKFPEVQFLTFFDIYEKVIKRNKLENIKSFLAANENIQFKLYGKDHLAFLTMFSPSWDSLKIKKLISSIISDEYFTKHKLRLGGLPFINYLLNDYSNGIKYKLIPSMFAFAFIFCFIFTRSVWGLLSTFIPAFCSLFISMSIIKILYGQLNLVTSIVPLLVFVINLSLAFHLFFSSMEENSVKTAILKKGKPILLMLVTTCIGFGSLLISEIEVIRQFSILCVLSLLFSSMLTFLWVYLTLVGHSLEHLRYPYIYKYRDLFKKQFSLKTITIFSTVLILTALLIVRKIPIKTDATEFFPPEAGIKTSMEELGRKVFGIPLMEILISNAPNIFTLKDLQAIEKVEIGLEKKYQILSSNTFVREANYFYSGENRLPLLKWPYKALKANIKKEILADYPAGKFYRITLMGVPSGTKSYFSSIKAVEKSFKELPYKVKINGIYFNLMKSQNALIKVLGKSILLSLFVICILSAILFRDLKIIPVFLLINILPISAALICMYLLGISLNIATVMTFSISLGLIVDTGIHLVYNLRKGETFDHYFKTTITPIFASSILLIFSFLIFGTYGFLPIREFGITLAIALGFGVIIGIFSVPTLIGKKISD